MPNNQGFAPASNSTSVQVSIFFGLKVIRGFIADVITPSSGFNISPIISLP